MAKCDACKKEVHPNDLQLAHEFIVHALWPKQEEPEIDHEMWVCPECDSDANMIIHLQPKG